MPLDVRELLLAVWHLAEVLTCEPHSASVAKLSFGLLEGSYCCPGVLSPSASRCGMRILHKYDSHGLD